MSNFDDLLKKGKQSASGVKTEEEKWKELVATVMYAVHQLNDMYPNGKKHHMKLEAANCQGCQEAMFVLAVRPLDKANKPMRFHKSKWKYLQDHKYVCDKCRKD